MEVGTLSTHELAEKKAFFCCLVSPNAGKEQRKEAERLCSHSAVLHDDTSWRPSQDESVLVTFGISLLVKLFFIELHLPSLETMKLLKTLIRTLVTSIVISGSLSL